MPRDELNSIQCAPHSRGLPRARSTYWSLFVGLPESKGTHPTSHCWNRLRCSVVGNKRKRVMTQTAGKAWGCYAAALGGCSGPLSREHFVSKNLLKDFQGQGRLHV